MYISTIQGCQRHKYAIITGKQERRHVKMKKILEYFSVDGAVGGSQEWFKNVVMYIGGCAAATACDCCIYLALHQGMEHLYPFDVRNLSRRDYVDFSMKMKPYLKPRVNGVNKLWMFTEGFGNYLSDCGEHGIIMEELSGSRSSCGRQIRQRKIDGQEEIRYNSRAGDCIQNCAPAPKYLII